MKSRYLPIAAALVLVLPALHSQTRVVLTAQEQAISDRIKTLRSLTDVEWVKATGEIARAIQGLPAGAARTSLMGSFGNLVTEGDAGRETLQIVASTMAQAIAGAPSPSIASTLATLVHYEHLNVSCEDAAYRAEIARLEKEDQRRANLDFTLTDLKGKKWSMKDLRGKVVLVNFWATWCPPCRREMPDMETLFQRFAAKGLVVLAISDEERAKVEPFLAEHKYSYPILLDPGRKVHELFGISGIPKSFVYGRDGKLAATGIDRRTERQFLEMFKMAGLE